MTVLDHIKTLLPRNIAAMLLVPGHNCATLLVPVHKVLNVVTVFQLETTWWIGNVQLSIDRSCCGGIITGRFVSLLI